MLFLRVFVATLAPDCTKISLFIVIYLHIYIYRHKFHFFSLLGAMLQKGLQDLVAGRVRCRYERLICDDDHQEKVMARPRSSSRKCYWVKKMNGRLIKGLRLSPRSRKLTLKALSAAVVPSKIIRMYADVLDRMKMDGLCPNLIFSAQWGLPVLSYPSLKCKRSLT